jgi:putative transposase
MGRPPRPIADDLTYHALNRGNNRSTVFRDEGDFQAFLQALAQTQARYPFRLYGYCLMTNHFHLLLRPEPGVAISRVLQSLCVAHTWRYHRRHRSVGHVWQGRFKSPVIQEDAHLWAVLRYIEANPLRAGMVTDLADYPWSSYPAHGLGRPDPLVTALAEWSDLGATDAERQACWRAKVHAMLSLAELTAIRDSVRSGRPYGHRDWSERQNQALGLPGAPRPRGRPRKHQGTKDPKK